MSIAEKLDEKFGLPSSAVVACAPQILLASEALPDDAETSRKTVHDLIEKGLKSLDGIMNVAQQTDSPRAYEVVSNMLKTLSDLSKDLLDIKEKAKELAEPGQPKGGPTVGTQNNYIFAGTTKDAMRALVQARAEEIPVAEAVFEVVKDG